MPYTSNITIMLAVTKWSGYLLDKGYIAPYDELENNFYKLPKEDLQRLLVCYGVCQRLVYCKNILPSCYRGTSLLGAPTGMILENFQEDFEYLAQQGLCCDLYNENFCPNANKEK